MTTLLDDTLGTNGDFAVTEANKIKGGHQEVANLTERDAISATHRSQGMQVWVISESKLYVLKTGLNNVDWVETPVASVALSNNQLIATNGSGELISVANTNAISINTKTANYILAATDNNNWVIMNSSSALTVTIPNNTNVPIPIGFTCTVQRLGTGAVTFVLDSSVTLNGSYTSINVQYGVVGLIKIDTNNWSITGALS